MTTEGHPSDVPAHEQVRTKEPQAPVGQDEPNPTVVSDATSDEVGDQDPGLGGYQGRDPKTEMPKIPSVPETQGDPHEHGAAPSPGGKEEQGSSGQTPRPGKGDG
jgi:hypothetical protein